MDFETERRLAMGLPRLRQKELRSRLTLSEQQELEEYMTMKEKELPDYKKKQLNSGVLLYAIRNYTFEDVTPKPSFFQKLTKTGPGTPQYLLSFPTLPDANEEDFPFQLMLELRDLLYDSGLGNDWPKMLPVEVDMYYSDQMDDEERAWFEALPEPDWCLQKLNEASGLEEKVHEHSQEMRELVQWLIEYWQNGFQIYADLENLFDYYGEDD
ncbi:hypothetical protein NCCP2716_28300 [Sporosarcina sp. NCCP-2716]|uniref:hypothetical protein n=1 Tax=Sporosarcina sp. NCCP-2716 TaxID=2943679 RepID=UPI002040AF3F|nr:hypothetical protein [Sporosarcina sp. NCCP-2716]GKV70332.1 hypothetical protein NCCP2716_28300 [Sporosarcina sp. NCCP-2716]